MSWLHQGLIWVHIAAGLVALAAGAAAASLRKGGPSHGSTGTWFCAAMLVVGASAAILDPLRAEPASPVGGLSVC
jgi:uncharacterized membrane protein